MTSLIIVLVVVAIIVLAAMAVLNPILKKRADGAIEDARTALGGRPNVRLIEPKAVGHGSEPDEAGGLRGQGVLAVSETALVFVTWAPRKRAARRAGSDRRAHNGCWLFGRSRCLPRRRSSSGTSMPPADATVAEPPAAITACAASRVVRARLPPASDGTI